MRSSCLCSKEGESISEAGRRELLELHARVSFRGLRIKRSEVRGAHFIPALMLLRCASRV